MRQWQIPLSQDTGDGCKGRFSKPLTVLWISAAQVPERPQDEAPEDKSNSTPHQSREWPSQFIMGSDSCHDGGSNHEWSWDKEWRRANGEATCRHSDRQGRSSSLLCSGVIHASERAFQGFQPPSDSESSQLRPQTSWEKPSPCCACPQTWLHIHARKKMVVLINHWVLWVVAT